MFGDLVSIPINTTIDPPLGVCFNCWQDGHARKACPRPKVARYCLNCGRRGVDLYFCLRCGPAHAKYVEEKFGQRAGSSGGVVSQRETIPANQDGVSQGQPPVCMNVVSANVPQPASLTEQTRPSRDNEPDTATGTAPVQAPSPAIRAPPAALETPTDAGTRPNPTRHPTVEEIEAAARLAESLQRLDEDIPRTIKIMTYCDSRLPPRHCRKVHNNAVG